MFYRNFQNFMCVSDLDYTVLIARGNLPKI